MSPTPAQRAIFGEFIKEIRRIAGRGGLAPEQSLYTTFHNFLVSILGDIQGLPVNVFEIAVEEVGHPDFVIETTAGPVGYVEAKDPEKNLNGLTGHDASQKVRYLEHLENWILTNYRDFVLYASAQERGRASLCAMAIFDPTNRDYPDDPAMDSVLELFSGFLMHAPLTIRGPQTLSSALAKGARLVRASVEERLEATAGVQTDPLRQLFQEYRNTLFADLDEKQFADVYAQTLAYGFLVARMVSGATLRLEDVATHVPPSAHRLLRATLLLLTNEEVTRRIGWTVNALMSIVNRASPEAFVPSAERPDPVIYFYEDFLAAYDPVQRRKEGVYFTPLAVVRFMVNLVETLLVERLDQRMGFVSEPVLTLDPAVGTGTFLVEVLNSVVRRVRDHLGEEQVPSAAEAALNQVFGFEILIGPYTVAHLRLAAAGTEYGIPPERTTARVILTNTLLPPHEHPATPPVLGFMATALTQEREAADRVKSEVPILVIIGNPPYGRGQANENTWIWNDLLGIFREGVRPEYRIHLKQLAEQSIYFYRWALWKMFDHERAPRRGVLCYISNRTFLQGEAFEGMRWTLRRLFDDVFVIDLFGESRGPLPADVAVDENVFDIQVGVAICACVATGTKPEGQLGRIHYRGLRGTREAKFETLELLRQALPDLTRVGFETFTSDDPRTPFIPAPESVSENWPALDQVFRRRGGPGVQTKRDRLVIAPLRSLLIAQIQAFLTIPGSEAERRSAIFHDANKRAGSIKAWEVQEGHIVRYSYRPLDLQWLYNDSAFIDRPRPDLQAMWGTSNLALYTLPRGHGAGPAAFLCSHLPDNHAFRGSFAGHAFPLWDWSAGALSSAPLHNVRQEVLDGLSAKYSRAVNAEEVFNYTYAILSAPRYTYLFARELQNGFPRIPFPDEDGLFSVITNAGEKLVRLHSFRDHYPGDESVQVSGSGEVNMPSWSGGRLSIGAERIVEPVSEEAWEYSVSGYPLLRRWIEGRIGLPFDVHVDAELRDVIWILERTVEMVPVLQGLLDGVVAGRTLSQQDFGM